MSMELSIREAPENAEAVLTVNRKGLAKKVEGKPRVFILYELVQNAWDEQLNGATFVKVTAEMVPGKPLCYICVEDDGPGFKDIKSVYEMFRDSYKADNPEQRGRFELGEKMVIALMTEGRVHTTSGTVYVKGDKRWSTREKRKQGGTVIEGYFRMNREQFSEMCFDFVQILPPVGMKVEFNGRPISPKKPLRTITATLPTVRVDEEGNLKDTERKTTVDVYEVLPGETPSVYEMGLPVVELDGGDQWHYDVQQKVPVNWERNNVPPRFLKTIRVEVLNAMHDQVRKENAQATWVSEAIEDERCEEDANEHVLTERFGKKRVIFDPSDPEGTNIAMSKGYTVIPGGSLSRGAWDNVRRFGTALPAGKVTPSPKPYDTDGRPERVKPREQWTDDMWRMAEYTETLFLKLTGEEVMIYIVTEPTADFAANFQRSPLSLTGYRVCLNYGKLGKRWFARKKIDPQVNDLLLHEFVHHTVSNHLSDKMHEKATELGAKLAQLVFEDREFFEG